ncbi:MAG: hypothetical protein JWL90_7 [Chthoniobacteraceae bacterium]|nr:hypothetical protein [Chthoniobacteraceae bacterium]
MMKAGFLISRSLALLALVFTSLSCSKTTTPIDEAKAAGKTTANFAEATVDVFSQMDGLKPAAGGELTPVKLDADEIKGRNTWMLWCGGNEAFWDWMAVRSYGLTDLIKTLDSRTRKKGRFKSTGLINNPDFKEATKPDEYGIWLDEQVTPEIAGVEASVYGKPTGIVGLRLFPNPNFDDKAKAKWNGERYYNDPSYYEDPALVRPYRIGMSCGFCHASFHPLYPPADVEAPKWANLSSNIGAQYWKTTAVFGAQLSDSSFVKQLLSTAQPGTVDTSLIASDGINNPNTMNAVFNVPARVKRALSNPKETQSDANNSMPDIDYEKLLNEGKYELVKNKERHVPHILVDGADSCGVWVALARVYVNIGEFHQLWNECHNPLVGLKPQKPFEVKAARENSVYWQTSEIRVDNLAKFFIKSTPPMKLADAPEGDPYITKDQVVLTRGKQVFAEHCMTCHSSKQPTDGSYPQPGEFAEWAKGGPRKEAYLTWARAEVAKPDFLEGNYLSTDQRYPVSLIGTNSARARADNATRGHVWDNFSSETYKTSPSIGAVKYFNPYTQKDEEYMMPDGGPGYYRVPTLISIWATAPYLHNNELGIYNSDPSVKGRVAAFEDGIAKLLSTNEERRKSADPVLQKQLEHDHGLIRRTTETTYVQIAPKYLPGLLMQVTGDNLQLFFSHPWLGPLILVIIAVILATSGKRAGRIASVIFVLLAVALLAVSIHISNKSDGFTLGPIPKGTPVALISNLNPNGDKAVFKQAVGQLVKTLKEIKKNNLNEEAASALLSEKVGADLLKATKCPDLVVDRGHNFGAELPPEDKTALIEFVKTF